MSNNDQHQPALDVSGQRVARAYAEALWNAAEGQGKVGEVLEELDSLVHDLFRADATLEAFLSSRAIGRVKKKEVIASVFGSRASPLFTNFLQVLNEHDRLDLIRAIHAAIWLIHDDHAGRIRVLVKTALPLPDDQRERLAQQLRESLRQEPLLEMQVDPSLLGGMVVRVGDWLYDASIRSRLDTYRNQLIERSSHEIQSRRDRYCTDGTN